jgi:HAE1 family hydrophobic/amphiphilic exporter-1
MSVLTSVGGMLPLVLFPGSGSEMYRGLGSVVVGGLVVSTVFTLVLVPLLLSITVQAMEGLRAVFGPAPEPGGRTGDRTGGSDPDRSGGRPVAPEPTRELQSA